MGLQLRLRHPLGSKVIDLPDRSADKPIMVGRAASAEVQVPSFSASEEHCGLYVHAGHWYVQDCSGAGETYVNGQPADEPTALSIGDYIQLGSEAHAPTLEVEPAAAAEGRAGYATAAPVAARPAAAQQQRRPAAGGAAGQRPAGQQRPPAHRPAAQHPSASPYAAPAGYPGQSAAGYAVPAGYAAEPVADSDDVMAGWGGTPSNEPSADAYNASAYGGAMATAPARRPGRKQNNAKQIIMCIGAGLAVVGGVLGWAATRNKQEPVVQQPAPPPAPVKSGKTSLFLEHGDKPAPRGTPTAASAKLSAEPNASAANEPKGRKPEPGVIEAPPTRDNASD